MILLINRQDKKGEVKVAFCPTHDMLGNFLLSHYREHYLHGCSKRYLTCPAVLVPLDTRVCWINKIMMRMKIMNWRTARCKIAG